MKDDDILNAVLSQLGDSYEYIKPLGEGASSKVYLLYHRHLKQKRALKIMDYEFLRQLLAKGKGNSQHAKEEFDKRKKRFINEAKVYKKIKHPHIAEIYDIRVLRHKIEDIEIPYIIMQYVEGETLRDLLKKSKKPLGLAKAAAISQNILDALAAIHQKDIVHRDLKPSNIMIEKKTGKAILIDFGLAKDLTAESTRLTSTGLAMGTPLYMSPEHFKDSSKAGPKSDIYSFGVILYEMLTGSPPYLGTGAEIMCSHILGKVPDIKTGKPDLPDIIDTLIRKSMAKQEDEREGDINFYKNELESFIEKSKPSKIEPGINKPLVIKPKPVKIAAYAASVLLLAVISYYSYRYFYPPSPEPGVENQQISRVKQAGEKPLEQKPGNREIIEKNTALLSLEKETQKKVPPGEPPMESIGQNKVKEKSSGGEDKKLVPPSPSITSPSKNDQPVNKDDRKQSEGKVNLQETNKPPESISRQDEPGQETRETTPPGVNPKGDSNVSVIDWEKIETGQRVSYQPDPIYYGVKRDELLNASAAEMKTFPIRWIVACAREGASVYRTSSLKRRRFRAAFLQRFEVIKKEKDKVQVIELDPSNGKKPRSGWIAMQNLIYLPRAIKDERTSVYQKVVFTHIEEHLEAGKIGDITFYNSTFPGKRNEYETRTMGTLRIAYVYAWENTDYEDSQFVLIGNYPTIEGLSSDKKAFEKTIYGWCKIDKLFPWNSRIALIPNKEQNARCYIFIDGPSLTNFYSKAGHSDSPDPKYLLTDDPYKMWQDSKWPFFLEGRFNAVNQDYVRLVCQVKVKGKGHLMKFGYAKEFDPDIGVRLFHNVYLFRKSEISQIIRDLNRTLEMLKPRKINSLWKDLIERTYGEEYDHTRTFNHYAQMHDGITYKELSFLFGKTQQQLSRISFNEFDEIEQKLISVKARLGNLMYDISSGRFFGSPDDPYIWLYEEEMP